MIIVAQKFDDVNDGIKKRLLEVDPDKAEKVVFTPYPVEVLNIIDTLKADEGALVISGEVFDHPIWGVDLARAVKNKNPNVIFFIYSVTPTRGRLIDGFIPKNAGLVISGKCPLVAGIISHYKKGMTPDDLKEKFPEITLDPGNLWSLS